MTRKDYEKIAAVIKRTREIEQKETDSILYSYTVAHSMAAMLTQDNPRFNRDRFLKACGVE